MPSFETKTIMEKRLWMFLLMVLSLAACGIEEVSRRPVLNREDVWTGPGMDIGPSSKEVLYVTAFDYPNEYDWRTDPEKGAVKCSLVVFADGLPMMKVPVGDSYQVSSDPDMHRMIDGHLYTDYSTDAETVIKKDGVTIVRYDAREVICGMIVQDDTLYTLGHPRSGEGFALRRNGEVLLERTSGRSTGRLQSDQGNICFAYIETISSGEDIIERYYHYSGGKVVQVAVRDDVRKVWDMISFNGEICYIASLTGVGKPVLFMGSRTSALTMPEGALPLSFEFISDNKNLFWEGMFTSADMSLSSALWYAAGDCIAFDEGMQPISCRISGDGINCVFNPSSLDGMIFRNGEEFPIPAGYAVMGAECAAVSAGILHVGLSSSEGGRPVVWKDGIVDTLDVHGFIASVNVH